MSHFSSDEKSKQSFQSANNNCQTTVTIFTSYIRVKLFLSDFNDQYIYPAASHSFQAH